MRMRSTLNPEEQNNVVGGPTRYRMGPNQSELICGVCYEAYYVDDDTFFQAVWAMEEGLDNPFCCDDCEEEQEEVSH